MRATKRRFLLAGLAIATGVFAPVGAHAQTGGTLEISAGSFVKKLMETMASEFEKQNPGVKVNLITGSRNDDDLAQDLLRHATVGSKLPDIVVAGNHVRLLAERGLAVAIDPLLAAKPNSILLQATPAAREKGRENNKIYGVAFGLSMPVVLFNADLVRKAGGDPEKLPTDWAGIFELAGKINTFGSPIVGGFMEADNTGALTLLYLLQSHGGRMMSADEGQLTIDTPEGLEALKVPQAFGSVGQAKASMTRDQARQAFGAGTIGVLVGMSSAIPILETAAKDRFKIVSVPYPVPTERGSLPTAGPIASILAKDPRQQKIAFDFLEFLISPKGQFILATTSGYAPINERAIAESDELKRVLAERSNAHSYLARLPVATRWYTPPGDNPAKIAKITTDRILEVVTLKTTPQEALQAMSQEIAPLLPKK